MFDLLKRLIKNQDSYTLKDMLRAFGLRAIAAIKAQVAIAEMPLAVVQRINWMKNVVSPLLTIRII